MFSSTFEQLLQFMPNRAPYLTEEQLSATPELNSVISGKPEAVLKRGDREMLSHVSS